MTKLISLLVLSVLVLIGCKPNDDPQIICDPAPPPSLSDFVFRIEDKNTGEELLVPGKLNPDSASVTQNCNNSTDFQFTSASGYLVNQSGSTAVLDSSKVVYSFRLEGLKAKFNNEGPECEYAYIHWSNADTDTLRLSTVGDGCDQPRVTTLTFNGEVVPLSVNRVTWQGATPQYYLLKK